MTLTILEPGLLTTVQDAGRPGFAHLGVPRSGALDQAAAALANRLVGNPGSAAVLETTLLGARIGVDQALTFAVTGAEAELRAGTAKGARRLPFAEAFTLPAGTELWIGPAIRGVRSYLAVTGGIEVTPVLGSRSTDTLAEVGPSVLSAGCVLPVGVGTLTPAEAPATVVHHARLPTDPAIVHFHAGPRVDWFRSGSLRQLSESAYVVAPESSRIGLRLSGPALRRHRARQGDLPSEGMVLGAMQVPPDGQPVVFLRDHPVTGGYPVLAVVDEADLDLCAQLRPGATVRFVPA